MIPILHQKNDKPLFEQIYEFYRDAILHQRLKHNDRVPSYRLLAKELGVGNNTVLKAYEQLTLEGYLKNEHRRGLYVTRIDHRDWQVHTLADTSEAPAKPSRKKASPPFSASIHLVDEAHFPMKQWRKCSNWALDHVSFQYQEHESDDPLKEQLIRYLFNYRGVRATPDRLLIGSGASVLIFWLAFVLRKTCSRIAFEEPAYARTRSLFTELNYKIKPIPVSANGIDLHMLEKEHADLLYLTPSHQYPTGAAIPVSHRIQILNWARKNNAYIIEDDFDCEFRYKTRLMPSLQGLDTAGRVIYVGTFSSALMPSLRVAYMVLPDNFNIPHQSLTYLTNTVPYFVRKTLAHFMERGFWEQHLRKMKMLYKKKYDTCIAALEKIPGSKIQFNKTPSGLNILLRINTRLSESELIKRAAAKGILITPVSPFYLDKKNQPKNPEVLLEFGSMPENEIGKVVSTLYRAWFPS